MFASRRLSNLRRRTGGILHDESMPQVARAQYVGLSDEYARSVTSDEDIDCDNYRSLQHVKLIEAGGSIATNPLGLQTWWPH